MPDESPAARVLRSLEALEAGRPAKRTCRVCEAPEAAEAYAAYLDARARAIRNLEADEPEEGPESHAPTAAVIRVLDDDFGFRVDRDTLRSHARRCLRRDHLTGAELGGRP